MHSDSARNVAVNFLARRWAALPAVTGTSQRRQMPKPGVGQRRERRTENGVLLLRCWGAFHDGDWMNADRFFKRGGTYSTLCKECHQYKYIHDRGYEPSMRLEEVRKWIWEIVHRCGSMSAAARTLGISSPTLFRWLGRYKGYEQKWIQRNSVRRVIETLAGLRAGTIEPQRSKKNGGKVYKYGCRGCGGPLDSETPGCSTCWERIYNRERRAGGSRRRRVG